MDIRINLLSSINHYEKKQLWELLSIIDDEFIPPLSNRKGTTQLNFTSLNKSDKNGLETYYLGVLKQEIIAARVNNEIVGFISFINNYKSSYLPLQYTYNYITTIGILPKFRRQRIATYLYDFILNELPDNLKCKHTATRTWSSNFSHINLLIRLNFKLINTIKNERLEKIDTVYYMTKEE